MGFAHLVEKDLEIESSQRRFVDGTFESPLHQNPRSTVSSFPLVLHVSSFSHHETYPKIVDSPITDSFETFILIETEITSVDDSGSVCLYCQLIQRREITFKKQKNSIENG